MNNDSDSVQSLTNKRMIRETCSAHTGNLAIDDMFENDNQYGFEVSEMKISMNNLPEGSYRDGYCPHLKTIRLKSLYKWASFHIENFDFFKNSKENLIG